MPSLVKTYFSQMVDAVFLLHEVNQLVHLDIKPDNVIIKNDLSLKVIDFGLS